VLVFACCIGELGDLIAFRDTRAIQQINARSAGQRDGQLRLSGMGFCTEWTVRRNRRA
jgi:hypothetical protein